MRKIRKPQSARSQHRKGLRRLKRARVHQTRLDSIWRMPTDQRAEREIAIRGRMGMDIKKSPIKNLAR